MLTEHGGWLRLAILSTAEMLEEGRVRGSTVNVGPARALVPPPRRPALPRAFVAVDAGAMRVFRNQEEDRLGGWGAVAQRCMYPRAPTG